MAGYHLSEEERNLQEILRSGDLARIRALDLEMVVDNFGDESFEYLAVQHRLADEIAARGSSPKNYIVPAFSESPLTNRNMLRRWIQQFTELNGLELPTGFWKKNRPQLEGMYRGMLKTYGVHPEQTLLDGFYWR
jgi:hypothetical protein